MKSNVSPIGMDYVEFGRFLLDTYDLDPLYVILAEANWPEKFMYRWLLAYWVFYSAGVASRVAEAKDYYGEMVYGDLNHWPRGHERRHMRAQQLRNAVAGLKSVGSPEKVVIFMLRGNNFQDISSHVQTFVGFGPWISWKIADMAERVLCKSVSFEDAEIGVYKDPVYGAALIGFGDQEYPITLDEVHTVFDKMKLDFKGYKAPPYQDRRVNIQEFETIACKYKSHCNRHYPLGLDTIEIYHGLVGWGDAAQELGVLLAPYVRSLEVNYNVRTDKP